MAKPLVISVAESRDGGASHVFVFDRGPVVVGRDPGSNLVIDRDVVSGVHGVFAIAGSGAVTFCDLGSRNGTLLNGRSLPPDDAVALGRHDVLSIGNLCLQVLDERPKTGFGPEAANPFAPNSSAGASKSLPNETAVVSPADVAAARALGRPAKQPDAPPPEERLASPVHVDRIPTLQLPLDDADTARPEEGGVPERVSRLPTSRENAAWPAAPEVAPAPHGGGFFGRGDRLGGPRYDSVTSSHELPLADAGGTAILEHEYERGTGRQRLEVPSVAFDPSRTRRLAPVVIAAGGVIALVVALGLVVARKREPAVASPTAGASEASREAPIRAVAPTPRAPADVEPPTAIPAIAAPNKNNTRSSAAIVEGASSRGASTRKPAHPSKGVRPRADDPAKPSKVDGVFIMP
jgi:pSer/pThr/pTyr-binding forkhead associated (FHA) protein